MKKLDENHVYQRQFNYEELNQFIEKLCNRVNHEYNQGTGGIPILSLPKEKALLSPLPNRQIRETYKINHTLVKVNPSNMITYKSNKYSLPAGYYGKKLSLIVYVYNIY